MNRANMAEQIYNKLCRIKAKNGRFINDAKTIKECSTYFIDILKTHSENSNKYWSGVQIILNKFCNQLDEKEKSLFGK